VRAFLIGNALMWLRDYHLDGLRLDAVHALEDHRALHFLEELATEVQALAALLNRELILIAESGTNDPRLVTSREAGGYGLAAQWSDDFHHAVYAAISGERQGYYVDFGSLAALAKTYTRVFYHDGIWSAFRGRRHGRQVDVFRVPAHRFLGYLQDHDQVGNRATGDRIAASVSPELLKVAAGLVLTSPYTPMLFMGEEWGADTPWQYFTDHIEPWLAQAVAEGRKAEFAGYGWDAADVPDPQDEATFLRSKLDWEQRHRDPYLGLHAWYKEMIALRRARPELTDPRLDRVQADFDEDARWLLVRRGRLRVVANLGSKAVRLPLGQRGTGVLAASSPEVAIKQDTVTMPPATFAVIETRTFSPQLWGPQLRARSYGPGVVSGCRPGSRGETGGRDVAADHRACPPHPGDGGLRMLAEGLRDPGRAARVAIPRDGHGDRLADLPGAGPVGALHRRREQRIGPDGAGVNSAEVTRHG
jgi:1,4-alpha-glucan branching enzyme